MQALKVARLLRSAGKSVDAPPSDAVQNQHANVPKSQRRALMLQSYSVVKVYAEASKKVAKAKFQHTFPRPQVLTLGRAVAPETRIKASRKPLFSACARDGPGAPHCIVAPNKAFNYADRAGAERIAFVAPDEWSKGLVRIKDLKPQHPAIYHTEVTLNANALLLWPPTPGPPQFQANRPG